MGNIGRILCCEQNENLENLINENLTETKKKIIIQKPYYHIFQWVL